MSRHPTHRGTRASLTTSVSKRLGITHTRASHVLEALLSTITGHLAQGGTWN